MNEYTDGNKIPPNRPTKRQRLRDVSNMTAGGECHGAIYNFLLRVINFPKDLRSYFKGCVPIGPMKNGLALCDVCVVDETRRFHLQFSVLVGVYIFKKYQD